MTPPLHLTTSLLQHHALSHALGKPVLLKMENLQPSGSFKLRGIGLFCQRAAARGASHFVCPSGGNAGFAAAVAGAALAVAYRNLPALSLSNRPLIVVCGGIGVDLAKLAVWKNRFQL